MAAGEVYEHLTGSSLSPYRALWAYLSSAWSTLAAAQGVAGAAERAAQMLRIAHRAAARATWLREVQPLPVADPASDPIDDDAVTAILSRLHGPLKSVTKFDTASATMLADLARPDAPAYEQALVTLGTLLGAESSRPIGKGRADAVWIWPKLWMTLEAKSEQDTAGTLSMDCVRQANTHLDSVRADRDEDAPEGSLSLIVSPRAIVDPDAVPIAVPHLHLASPDLVLGVAHDAVQAWKAIRTTVSGTDEDGDTHLAVAKAFWEHQVLPTQALARLAVDPIRGA